MRTVLIMASLLSLAGAAQAQEAMSTAGASGTPPSADTAQQIEQWLADSPAVRPQEDGAVFGLVEPRDRRIHGEVGLAVGTGGYRSGYITSVMPIGETGVLALTLGQEKNGYRHWADGQRMRGPFDDGPIIR